MRTREMKDGVFGQVLRSSGTRYREGGESTRARPAACQRAAATTVSVRNRRGSTAHPSRDDWPGIPTRAAVKLGESCRDGSRAASNRSRDETCG